MEIERLLLWLFLWIYLVFMCYSFSKWTFSKCCIILNIFKDAKGIVLLTGTVKIGMIHLHYWVCRYNTVLRLVQTFQSSVDNFILKRGKGRESSTA